MEPNERSEQRDSSPDGSDVVHLVLPVGEPMAQLIRAQTTFHDLLREVSRAVAATADDPVTWVVTGVTASSADYALAPQRALRSLPPGTVHRMVQAVPAGMATLAERAERPPYFSDRALTLAANLSSIGLPWLRTRNGASEVAITRAAATHAQRILDMPYVSEMGTVEGRLEQINVHGGKREFVIFDELTGDRIDCHFGHRIAVDEIKVERRVAVTGEIRSRENGAIVSVIATEIEVFPPDDELPTAQDVFGILAG